MYVVAIDNVAKSIFTVKTARNGLHQTNVSESRRIRLILSTFYSLDLLVFVTSQETKLSVTSPPLADHARCLSHRWAIQCDAMNKALVQNVPPVQHDHHASAVHGVATAMNHSPSELMRYYEAMAAALGPMLWWPARTPSEVIVGAILVQSTAWGNAQLPEALA